MDTKQYVAEFKDEGKISANDVFMLGVSPVTQPNYKGAKLDAIAKMFCRLGGLRKTIFLCDYPNIFNLAAETLLESASKTKQDSDGRRYISSACFIDPLLWIESLAPYSDGWIKENAPKFAVDFNKKHNIDLVICHKQTVNDSRYSEYLVQTIRWYTQNPNTHNHEKFIEEIDKKVSGFLKRSKAAHKVTQLQLDYNGSRLKEDDIFTQAVQAYLARDKRSSSRDSASRPYLENPVYHELVKMSMCYALHELVGIRVACRQILEKVRVNPSDSAQIHMGYPGLLGNIHSYFSLVEQVENIPLRDREISLKSKVISIDYEDSEDVDYTKSYSKRRHNTPPKSQASSSSGNSSEESTAFASSPPEFFRCWARSKARSLAKKEEPARLPAEDAKSIAEDLLCFEDYANALAMGIYTDMQEPSTKMKSSKKSSRFFNGHASTTTTHSSDSRSHTNSTGQVYK